MTGPGTATPGGADRFAARLGVPHDRVSIDDTQLDFYDDPRTVGAATEAALQHFRSTP